MDMMIIELNVENMKVGLRMNVEKTKPVCNSSAENNRTKIKDKELEFVD